VQPESDFPVGHPARADYDPTSPEAIEWARQHVHPRGERDFPVDHPKAADTPGNETQLVWRAGVDPRNPHREAFTGRTPEQAAGVRALSEAASKAAVESPVLIPIDAVAVGKLLDAKRAQVGHDILTPEEHQAVLAEYHKSARVAPEKGPAPGTLTPTERAIAYVVSRGYTPAAASEIVQREGAIQVLRQAGLEE
jgi:hypothetical protein